MKERLELCQKSLNEYLDVKKKIFPRFYFVSSVALLDMLANGTNPRKIVIYLGDCYDALNNVVFVEEEGEEKPSKKITTMIAKDKETCPMYIGEDKENPVYFEMEGEVEVYLNNLTEAMQTTLRHSLSAGLDDAADWDLGKELPRHKWVFKYPAQIVATGSQICWTEETQSALEELEGGQEDSVKRHLTLSKERLAHLIDLVLGDLLPSDRVKIITLITLDVHARDVVETLIVEKVEGPAVFQIGRASCRERV